MSAKQVIRSWLPPILLDRSSGLRTRWNLQQFVRGGKIPWSRGYSDYKSQQIIETLGTEALLQAFRAGERLPPKFGYGLDERCVEYPWLLSRLSAEAKCILDAGSVLNHQFILDRPFFKDKKLHILTLAPECDCFWSKGISYFYDDLRSIPIHDHYYDAVVCLSTLEHIGCDNTIYAGARVGREDLPKDFQIVMGELRRTLKPGGSLFVSVPFGSYRHHGTFQQFDRAMLSQAIAAFGDGAEVTETFYRYGRDGWQIAADAECAQSSYVEWVADVWLQQRFPDPLPVESDLAAAARAVACVQFVKGR